MSSMIADKALTMPHAQAKPSPRATADALAAPSARSAGSPAGIRALMSRRPVGHSTVAVAQGSAAAAGSAESSFRLTRRGRFLLLGLPAILLLAAFFMSIGMAASGAMASSSAEVSTSRVTVEPGETLWAVAHRANPQADTRAVVRDIMKLNGLTSENLAAGEQITVPVYAK